MTTVAIIGTAGRKEDGKKLTRGHYDFMLKEAESFLSQFNDICLVSGGAAVSDHCAVSLYLSGKGKYKLTLYLPAIWTGTKFENHPDDKSPWNTAKTANYYHTLFSKKCGIDSFYELQRADALGAEFITIPGFFERNSYVAKADVMLAFTFNPGDVPSDGGTKDTWNKSNAKIKKHISLSDIGIK